MQSKAATVAEYLKALPADRRAAISAVRETILKNLDKGFQETMQYGMIGYSVPHSIFPDGYHCDPKQPLPYAGLASQKNYMSVYLCTNYGNGVEEQWLRDAFKKAGKKLDMGKCCIRFKKVEDVPLDLIGRTIASMPVKDFVAFYEQSRADYAASKSKKKPATTKKTPAKRPAAKKAATKKSPVKKTASKKTATKKK